MIYLAYDGSMEVAGLKPHVSPAGSFGKKMTMDDLIAKQMRVTRQENAHCELVSFDQDAANGFQHYVNESLAFAVKHRGFMHGTVSDVGKAAQAVELHVESELKEWVTTVVKLEGGKEGKVNPKVSLMRKDVVVGGKDVREVDNDFFLVVVKIFDHQLLRPVSPSPYGVQYKFD
ncbi:hypothetical protein Ancab_021957 [Ancistrocladus abbreviatus]